MFAPGERHRAGGSKCSWAPGGARPGRETRDGVPVVGRAESPAWAAGCRAGAVRPGAARVGLRGAGGPGPGVPKGSPMPRPAGRRRAGHALRPPRTSATERGLRVAAAECGSSPRDLRPSWGPWRVPPRGGAPQEDATGPPWSPHSFLTGRGWPPGGDKPQGTGTGTPPSAAPHPESHRGDVGRQRVPKAGLQRSPHGCRAGLMRGRRRGRGASRNPQLRWEGGSPLGTHREVHGGVLRSRSRRPLMGETPGELVFEETRFRGNE